MSTWPMATGHSCWWASLTAWPHRLKGDRRWHSRPRRPIRISGRVLCGWCRRLAGRSRRWPGLRPDRTRRSAMQIVRAWPAKVQASSRPLDLLAMATASRNVSAHRGLQHWGDHLPPAASDPAKPDEKEARLAEDSSGVQAQRRLAGQLARKITVGEHDQGALPQPGNREIQIWKGIDRLVT